MKDIKEVTGSTDETPKKIVKGFPIRRPQDYRIYRANKDLKGSATKWNVRLKQEEGYVDAMLFIEATVQIGIDANGNGKYAWEDASKTVKMKLEAVDIGTILATLGGITKETKLFHKNEKGNTVLNLSPATNPGTYYLSVSSQFKDGKTKKVQQTLGSTDIEILKVLLKDAISLIYYWR